MNVGKATAREAFTDVVNALYDFRNDFIKFPTNEVETRASTVIGSIKHGRRHRWDTYKNKGSKRKRCQLL